MLKSDFYTLPSLRFSPKNGGVPKLLSEIVRVKNGVPATVLLCREYTPGPQLSQMVTPETIIRGPGWR